MATINTLTGWVNKFLKKEVLLDNEKTEARTLIGASPDLTAGPIRSTNGTSSVHSSFGIAQVTGLQGALDGKLPTVNPHIPLGGTCDTPPSDDNTQRVANTTWVNNYGTSKENILNKLKGTVGNANRIGAEYMPNAFDVDYIVVGEAGPEAELPEGGLARLSGNLVMYDANGTPIPVGGDAQENIIPYHRASGVATVIPYGVTNSPAKIAGTYHWHEIARIKVPASEAIDGNILYLELDVTMESQVAIPLLKNVMRIALAEEWDAALGTPFQSATPVGRIAVPTGNTAVSTCKSSVTRFRRSHAIVRTATDITIENAAAGTYTSGYDITNAAAFTSTAVLGNLLTTKSAGTDLELVLIACVTATANDFRSYGYTFSAYASAP